MEGGDVWYYDPLVGGHDFAPVFGIECTEDPHPLIGLIIGVPNTLMPGLEGLSSAYFGGNGWLDWLNAIPPAEVVFVDQGLPLHSIGVARGDAAHTIGISFELGGTDFVLEVMTEFVTFFEGQQ